MGIPFYFDRWKNPAQTTFSGGPPALLLSLRALENLKFLHISDRNFLLILISSTLFLLWLFAYFYSMYIQEKNMTVTHIRHAFVWQFINYSCF